MNQFVIVCDGTYCYCQKSSNNKVQRKTYSCQKKRHLVKIFVICTSDGYIVDILGPYAASDNDATILRDIIHKENSIKEMLLKEDILLLDRGFRDVALELKQKYNLNPKLPTCVPPERKQLTTREANESRFVTKCRWVIEVINSYFSQSYNALKNVRNKMLPHIMKDYKIAGSLINKFHRRLFSDGDNQIQIALKMKSLLNHQNHLDSETQNLKIKSQLFEKIDANDQLPDFPKILDLNQIKNNITLGSYQIKQCHGYIAEHKSVDGSYLIFANKQTFLTKNNNKLIAVEIQSRHSNNTKYKLFVEYTDIDSVDAIKGKNNLFFIFISLLKVYLFINNISYHIF